MKKTYTTVFSLLVLLVSLYGLKSVASNEKETDWGYGGGSAGTRYSDLKQINRGNVSKLHVAWEYDPGDGAGDPQTQPVVTGGILLGVSAKHKAFALDAATGKELWKFDSGVTGRGPNRGVTVWGLGKEKRVFVAVQHFVYALDILTGKPIPGFGSDGRIDLREGLGREPGKQSIVLTTPGIIYKDLLIVGGRLPESLPAPPGDIRAYDVRTGKLRWSFHTIPHPGEFGYETWPKDAWTYSGSANNWTGMAIDEKRGIVYVPTGSAASDFYGFDRKGDNLFANSLLALDAATGKRLWHFQAVKHDIWDRDFSSPPTLVQIVRNGVKTDAVAQTSKQGWLYLFDRVTGKPLFPIDYRPYPASKVPGEEAAKTQPLPLKPEPFSRQRLTEDMLTNRTPEAHSYALEKFRSMLSDGQFLPFAVGIETVLFPGFDGGAEWGGSAYDPETGFLYVNANDLPWVSNLAPAQAGKSGRSVYVQNCAACHGDDLKGSPPQMPALVDIGRVKTEAQLTSLIKQGAGRMPSFPSMSDEDLKALIKFLVNGEAKEMGGGQGNDGRPAYRFTGYRKFLDQEGYPAVVPPWGTLNAINLNTGEYVWKIPFGEFPELAEKGVKNTGTENYGGPVVTAGGLVFIAATNFDRKFRAFDKATGKLLWETTLPFAGNATPATFLARGKQYVVVHANGGKAREKDPKGERYIAFSVD